VLVGFAGSRPPTDDFSATQKLLVATQLLGVPRDAVIVTGGAKGVDGVIIRAARRRGHHVRTLLPVIGPALGLDTDWEAIEDTEVIRTRLLPPDRDRLLVVQVDRLRAIASYRPASLPRSGTYLTARLAQRARKLERLLVLHAQRLDGVLAPMLYLEPDAICVCHPHRCPCSYYEGRPCDCAHHRHNEA
jgi:hypothetical protein